MRNVMVASLFASAGSAQSTMTYLNLMWTAQPTLTLMSSDATATTYEKQCPTTGRTTTSAFFIIGSTTSWDSPRTFLSPDEQQSYLSSYFANPTVRNYYSTHLPALTPTTEEKFCVPFTLFQGPETWGFHLTDLISGMLTKNGNCTWTGAFTEAPITCDGEAEGTMYDNKIPSGSTTVIAQSELRSLEGSVGGFAVATVIMATPTETGTAESTTGSGVGRAEATQSSGLAVDVPRPTRLVAMVGRAAAVGAAAWVL